MRKRRSLYLPDEIWRQIFKNLKEQDLEEVSLVSKQFLSVTNSLKSILKISEQLLPVLPKVLQRFQFLDSIIICTQSLSCMFCVVLYFLFRLSHEARKKVKRLDFRVPILFTCPTGLMTISDCFPMLEEINLLYNPDLYTTNIIYVKFSNLVSNLKGLKKISFTGKCFVYDEFIFSLSKNSVYLEEICIETNYHGVTENSIGFVMRNNPKLTSLTLDSLKWLRPDSPFSIENSIAYAKNLQSLDFRNMKISKQLVSSIARANPPLKKLTISEYIENRTLSIFFEAFCSIEELHLRSSVIKNRSIHRITQYLTKLTRIDLSFCNRLNNFCFFLLTKSCPFLEEIKMDNTEVGLGDISRKELQKHHRIRRISISNNKCLDDNTLKIIVRVCSNLEFLNISDCRLLTGKSIKKVFKSCRFLTHLELGGLYVSKFFGKFFKGKIVKLKVLRAKSSKLNDDAMGEIGRICSDLEFLDVGYCENVTKVGVMEVVRNCKKLQKINLTVCGNLSINDFIIMVQTGPSLKKICIDRDFVPSEVQKNLLLKYGCKILDERDILW